MGLTQHKIGPNHSSSGHVHVLMCVVHDYMYLDSFKVFCLFANASTLQRSGKSGRELHVPSLLL